MKILYITTDSEDCISDGVLYGLRMRYGADLVDWPKKNCMYQGATLPEDFYGNGFTIWKQLPDIAIDRDHATEKIADGYYDVIIFADIFRQQKGWMHWNVYLVLHELKRMGKKLAFIDGTDDGSPTVYDAIKWGTYFKRENPNHYPILNIGLSIPEKKIRTTEPNKIRLFSTLVQCEEAYALDWIKANCSLEKSFDKEEDYYNDLASSMYGICMKKAGWDCPRFMENAANWTVNCIYTAGWDWDGKSWYDKPEDTHPKGLIDMENCILWDNPKQLVEKIEKVAKEDLYSELQQASLEWVKGRTCEKMADYVMANI